MGEEKDLLSTLLLELRRGTLTISVLSQMNKPKYGYALVQSLEEKGVAIDPNTLYPLLRRLESQQLLESKWETSGTKPRKYYQRTEYGTQVYEKSIIKCPTNKWHFLSEDKSFYTIYTNLYSNPPKNSTNL